MKLAAQFLLSVVACLPPGAAGAIEVAFLAHPRDPAGGFFRTQAVNERPDQYTFHEGTQLVIRDLESGAEQVLVDGRVYDFSVSIDGNSIYYSRVRPGAPAMSGCDIFRLNLNTGAIDELTRGRGWNCQPIELPDGIMFLTNRDGWKSPHDFTPALVIYRMDRSGRQVRRVWHGGLGGAFSLSLGPDGRLYFASGEHQGFHPEGWAIWSINQDGSDFQPEISSVGGPWVYQTANPWDWPTVASNGSLMASNYYDTRLYGLIHVAPKFDPKPGSYRTKFGNPLLAKNPPVQHGLGGAEGRPVHERFGWQRRGFYNLTPLATAGDWESVNRRTGEYSGIFTHPWPIPGNGAYFTWTGDKGDKNMNLGVHCAPDITKPIEANSQLVKVVDEPDRHEWMGKQVVSFREIYGIDGPPTPTGQVAEQLPEGTPYSVVGTSDVQSHFEWVRPGPALAGTSRVTMKGNEVEWVRILYFSPTLAKAVRGAQLAKQSAWGGFWSNEAFYSEINERTGFYDQLIPVRKYRTANGRLHLGPDPPRGSTQIMRSDGLPDTSWQAEIPANQPYTFQLLNERQQAIIGSTAETWHANIPRERRTDCQGCHAHWKPDPIPFDQTFAASQEYRKQMLRLSKVKTVVWDRDIKPLNLGVDQRPYATPIDEGRNLKTTDIHAYRSSEGLLDDPSWTDAQRRLVAAWQDTGFLAVAPFVDGTILRPDSNRGPYADTMNPTLSFVVLSDRVVVGACDPQSGIDKESLSVKLDGKELIDQFVPDEAEEIWTLRKTVAQGTLVFSVRDNHGNLTTIEKIIEPDEAPEGLEQVTAAR